jgi:4-diphosphocytidyl-2-C-methyl-D-erythritol kinase
MHVRRHARQIEVTTSAKINLFLEVLAKRPDGYHEIETLLTAITIYDTILLTPTASPEINLHGRWAHGLAAADVSVVLRQLPGRELLSGEIPGGRENLVWRAATLLRERAGIPSGANICLIKRIPAAAGLGGASADAAAALIAANIAWQLDWPRSRLSELAAELGSDVPFFLMRGAAVARGRGELLTALAMPRLHVVVVRPPVGLSTPRVYQGCQPTLQAVGVTRLTELLAAGNSPQAATRLVNQLQPAAARLTPWIATLQQEFEQQPVLGHQMSGSGSSYFGLCRTARQARRIASRLRARNIGAVMSATTAVAS